jgi:hypothetical protein
MEMKIDFEKVIQDSQEFGSDDEHMVSRVFFSLMVDGKEHWGLHSNIKQTLGADYETGAIEVSPPIGYDGPIDYEIFRQAVEGYYRRLIGSQGKAIRLDPGSTGIRMRNNLFKSPVTVHVFEKEQFQDASVPVDGTTFIECTFTKCTMQYSGGAGTVLHANQFNDCRWEFLGPAMMTLGFLHSLYNGGLKDVVEQFFDAIRQPKTKPN